MASENSSGNSTLRVLVVDDCVDTTDSVATLLKLWGHDARVAHDGPKALAIARSYRPHVVLLDIGLPQMDGYEVARHLRDEADEEALLICITGYAREADCRQALEAGFAYHFAKPADPDELHRFLALCKDELSNRIEAYLRLEDTVLTSSYSNHDGDGVKVTAPLESVDIGQLAERRLRAHPQLGLKNLSCAYRDGVLILSGRLPTYYLKQLAQAEVLQVDGVRRIDNQIEVAGPSLAKWR